MPALMNEVRPVAEKSYRDTLTRKVRTLSVALDSGSSDERVDKLVKGIVNLWLEQKNQT